MHGRHRKKATLNNPNELLSAWVRLHLSFKIDMNDGVDTNNDVPVPLSSLSPVSPLSGILYLSSVVRVTVILYAMGTLRDRLDKRNHHL